MSGIYIHIPFCKKACHYCNFHFTTQLSYIDEMVDAICKDIKLRNDYLIDRTLNTVYFGGGTPSLLNSKHLDKIFNSITTYFTISGNAEITLEANPDDVIDSNLSIWKSMGINRLSIGIQSFFDEDLKAMNRTHNAAETLACIEKARLYDFYNLSIDLIYGAHTTSDDMWQENISKALALDIPHISSYCMTIEDKTAYGSWLKSKKMKPIDEEKANRQFALLMVHLTQSGYDHYEISNFAKDGKYAIHNTNYWTGKHYLGIGPSAHSYNGVSRNWAVAHNPDYIAKINNDDESYIGIEQLTLSHQYNEYMMTSLRTMWGAKLDDISNKFGQDYLNHTISILKDKWVGENTTTQDGVVRLNSQGKYFADNIAAEFFFID